MPFSYAQYTGNGSTTTFSVPFPYLLKAHVKLYTGFNILDGTFTSQLVDGTDYTWTSGTQVQTTAAVANGVVLTVKRDTPDSSQVVTWQDGSNLIADDQNTADLQNLYVVQEQQDVVTLSSALSVTAGANAATALSTANAASATANGIAGTANTALSNANAAVATANAASATANAADATANGIAGTANTALSNANAAVATANAADATANGIAGTANTALSNANAAVATANAADATANGIAGTANAALPKAGGTMTGAITFAGGQSFPGAVTSVSGTAPVNVTAGTTPTVSVSAASTSAPGVAQLSDSTSSTSSSTAATSAAVKAVQDFAQTVSSVANAALPKAGGTMTGDLVIPSINGGPISGARNRIINGDMRIDQRNGGAAVTVNGSAAYYSVDRWFGFAMSTAGVFTLDRSTVSPNNFSNSLAATCTTADTSIAAGDRYFINQAIEGFNSADLGFGTSTAQAITLSFWVQSSLTGTYCVSILNSDGSRSYVAEYTINTADTWEYKTITVAGDTGGTWLADSGIGISVRFTLATGTTFQTTANAWAAGNFNATANQVNWMSSSSSRTFRITGVQLEAGTVATPFERRSYGQELALCQRYYEVTGMIALTAVIGRYQTGYWATEKRASPTLTVTPGAGSGAAVAVLSSAPTKGFHQSVVNSVDVNAVVTGAIEL